MRQRLWFPATIRYSRIRPNGILPRCDKLVDWMTEVGAQTPISKATNQPVPLPALIFAGVLGDLTGDGELLVDDWILFRSRLETTITASSSAEAISLGDFNFNLQIDRSDFFVFKTAYNNTNGAGALAAVTSVPEPESALLLLLAVGVAVLPMGAKRGGQSPLCE